MALAPFREAETGPLRSAAPGFRSAALASTFEQLENRVAPAALTTLTSVAVTDTPTNVVTATGSANLVTHLVLPSTLGNQSPGTLYVQYSNIGTTALAAPLLTLTATQVNTAGVPVSQALLTLDPTATADGPSVQILASGATLGVLQPGESETVPVYWEGWQQPWNPASPPFQFSLTVTQANDPTAINWASLQAALQPTGISAAAWSVLFAGITSQFGTTAGSYVQQLDAEAAYLGSLGERTIDVSQLWSVEIADALGPGFSLLPDLAAGTDATLPAPGLPLVFSRSFANSIVGRSQAGPLGYGWFDNWQTTLTVAGGTVTIHGEGGTQQVFLPNGSGGYTAPPGDFDTLTAPSGLNPDYLLRDQSGDVTAFRPGGAIDYLQDPDGNTIRAGYDSSGRLATLTHSSGQWLHVAYNSAGLISSVTDSTGGQTIYTYDATNHYLVAVTGPNGLTVRYTYDTSTGSPTSGALLSVAYPDGTHDLFSYDSEGRLATTAHDGGAEKTIWSYGAGAEVSITDADGNTTKYFFDARALVKTVGPLGNATTYVLDSRLDLVSITNALGQVTTNTYDADGFLTSSTDPAGNTVAYTYTQNGPLEEMASVVDANGNATSYSYDSQGNLLAIAYPDSATQQFSYDPLGDQIGAIDPDQQVTTRAYNANGLLTFEKFADGSSASFTYDAAGDLLTATTTPAGGLPSTTSYTYAATTHELVQVSYPNGLSLEFSYDAGGRRIQSVDQSGFTVNYQYDAMGRLARLTSANGQPIVSYIYDPAGRLIEKDLGNGTYTTYQYDAAGNLAQLTNFGPRPKPGQDGPVNSSFGYTYDALGRMTSMTAAAGEWTYTYDLAGNLVQAVFAPSSPATPTQNIQYLYDPAGNRTATIINGVFTNYTSNDRDEYVTVGATTYNYDADGNLISASDPNGTTTYTYNAADQLASVTTPDGTTSTYTYDALGDPIAVSTGGQTTDYLDDPIGLGYVVGTYTSSGSLIADYTYGLGLTSQTTSAGASYYDFDATGSTVGLTGASGSYLDQYSYLPYGVVASSAAPLANPFTFQGQSGVMANGGGALSMGTRDYLPSLGRFTTPDVLGITAGSANLVEYAANDPLNLSQPSGLTVMATGLWDTGAAHAAIEVSGQDFAKFAVLGSRQEDLFDAPLQAGYWSRGQEHAPSRQALSLEVPADMGQAMAVRALDQQAAGTTSLWSSTADALRSVAASVPGIPYVPGYLNVFLHNTTVVSSGSTLVALHSAAAASGTVDDSASASGNVSIGPAGYGTQNFVAGGSLLAYRVNFENGPGAAPAQEVIVTDPLDSSLDWSSFQFTEVGFGNTLLTLPAGTQDDQATVPFTWNGETFEVAILLTFNPMTGVVVAVFDAIDPTTGLPPDVSVGFLPPEDGSGRGTGHIGFTARPRAGLATGATIDNVASISVGTGSTVSTAPSGTDLVTIDNGPPMSGIYPLPAVEGASTFAVGWWGQDAVGGSGIAYYDVYYSDNGGAFQSLLRHTTLTSATFQGTPGHTYAFCCIATDNVGNVQPTPLAAQATTTVRPVISTAVTSSASTLTYGQTVTFTATLSATDPAAVISALAGEKVVFADDLTVLGTGTLNTHGVATFTATGLGGGLNVITATYGGDAADQGSTAALRGGVSVNRALPTFAKLTSSQSITAGTPTIGVSGVVSAPTAIPVGQAVTIFVGGVSTTAIVQAGGSFSAVLNTSGLAASASVYTITYAFGGANFGSITNSNTVLVVTSHPVDVTPKVSIQLGAMQHVAGSTTVSKYNYTQTVTIANTSGAAIAGPISLELVGLAGGSLYNASGVSRSVNPRSSYLLLSTASLAAGASVTVTLYFYDPTLIPPSYMAHLIAGGTP